MCHYHKAANFLKIFRRQTKQSFLVEPCFEEDIILLRRAILQYDLSCMTLYFGMGSKCHQSLWGYLQWFEMFKMFKRFKLEIQTTIRPKTIDSIVSCKISQCENIYAKWMYVCVWRRSKASHVERGNNLAPLYKSKTQNWASIRY